MLIVFGILILLACVLLGLFVLIQNPKGGGLSGSFGGIGNQVIGVRQTTDVLEKGTWVLAAIIAVLCLTSPLFIGKTNTGVKMEKSALERSLGNQPVQQQTPPPATPGTGTPGSKQ